MELKKYFHNKLISTVISMCIGVILVGLFIRLQTNNFIVVSTYALLFVVFTAFFQLIKATVQKFRNQKYKLNKEWLLFSATVLIAITLLLFSFYGHVVFFEILALILFVADCGASYMIYRFMYLTAIFKNKEVKQEVLYFSWRMWGDMLDDGATDEEVADLLVSAQTTVNYRFVNSNWGARFSVNQVYNDAGGESESSGDNVVIPVATLAELKELALVSVATYEKKN